MSIRGKALIAGVYEHPGRYLPDTSVGEIYAEVARGALLDAGLSFADVDGLFCDGAIGSLGVISISEYLGLRVSYVDSTETGGSSYLCHVGHAAAAIAAGKCQVALVVLAGKSRGRPAWTPSSDLPESGFELPYGGSVIGDYALAAQRHMYEYGTTSRDLAEIKVAASHHAKFNANAFLRKEVTIEEVIDSPLVADPLHRLDCCVVTDGGGAIVVVSPDIAKELRRTSVKVLGHGEAPMHAMDGQIDLCRTGAILSGPRAFQEARVTPRDIDYASIYDSFTITVLVTLEDLGFCEKGQGGRFVRDGTLQSPGGALPFNTDGGGLCNNHPAGRGGMTKVIEAVRQLRGEANPEVQVPDCELAIAHGTGGSMGTRMGSATLILGRADA